MCMREGETRETPVPSAINSDFPGAQAETRKVSRISEDYIATGGGTGGLKAPWYTRRSSFFRSRIATYREKSPRVFSRTIVHGSILAEKKKNGRKMEREKERKKGRRRESFRRGSCDFRVKPGGSGAQETAGGNPARKDGKEIKKCTLFPYIYIRMYMRRVWAFRMRDIATRNFISLRRNTRAGLYYRAEWS